MRKGFNLHESMEERTRVRLGSERSLGIVFAIVFLIVGLWPLLYSGTPRIWALVIAAVFVLLGFLAPKTLSPLNRLWFRLGMLLHRVINPLVMGIIFFLTVVPTGLGDAASEARPSAPALRR
jgi:predicted membrane metal-binding protein